MNIELPYKYVRIIEVVEATLAYVLMVVGFLLFTGFLIFQARGHQYIYTLEDGRVLRSHTRNLEQVAGIVVVESFESGVESKEYPRLW